MTEPEKKEMDHAVAIRYNRQQDSVPRVVAKGSGHIAKSILTAADQHGVPVYQNKTLVSMLMAVELEREIPVELYQAMAEILAYVYRLDQGRR
ncbi:MAG: FlhB domain protein [Firmicutes bacterium]|nr:FlhB domain protein [Bacillota bacterium]